MYWEWLLALCYWLLVASNNKQQVANSNLQVIGVAPRDGQGIASELSRQDSPENANIMVMSPSDLEEFILKEPFVPVRLTLASGDSVILDFVEKIWIAGLHLYYLMSDDPASRIGKKVKIISIPNIVLVKPIDLRRGRDGRRRR